MQRVSARASAEVVVAMIVVILAISPGKCTAASTSTVPLVEFDACDAADGSSSLFCAARGRDDRRTRLSERACCFEAKCRNSRRSRSRSCRASQHLSARRSRSSADRIRNGSAPTAEQISARVRLLEILRVREVLRFLGRMAVEALFHRVCGDWLRGIAASPRLEPPAACRHVFL
jgi:hypothetical protein